MSDPNKIELGDVVSFGWNDGYGVATVTQVHKDGTVDLLRPYIHTSDFSCSGRHPGSSSVLAYIGFEECKDINPIKLELLSKGKNLR